MKRPKKYTCHTYGSPYCYSERVAGAPEGTREEVLDWMESHFPDLREMDCDEMDDLEWRREYKGEVRGYKVGNGLHVGDDLYLVEKIAEANKEEVEKTLAELNGIFAKFKVPMGPEECRRQDPFVDKIRSLGWGCKSEELDDGHWQFRLIDPDSAEAMKEYVRAVELCAKMKDAIRRKHSAKMAIDEEDVAALSYVLLGED